MDNLRERIRKVIEGYMPSGVHSYSLTDAVMDVLREQEPVSIGVPAVTDEELVAFAVEEQFLLFCDKDEFVDIARSVLQRFAAAPIPMPTSERLKQERERCAKVCDEEHNRDDLTGDYRYAAGICASRIRNNGTNIDAGPLPVSVPEGWQIVPKEPTPEMISEACDCQDYDPEDGLDSEAYYLYRAMLAAAPKPPGDE